MHTPPRPPHQGIRRLRGAGILFLAASLLWAGARARRPAPLPRYQLPGRRQLGRRIPFDGARNLRDLGGYPAAGGRAVRWGALYRSDHLGRLSARDLRWLRALELAVVVDFRSSAERAESPNRLPGGHGIREIALPIFDNDAGAITGSAFKARILRGDVADIDAATMLITAYESFATTFTPVYRQFVAEVVAARGSPLLFHCTSGKDRTGFAAAILLRLLGVPEEVILADYLRSKTYSLAAHRRDLLLLRLLQGPAIGSLVRTLLGVEEGYIQAAFAAIDGAYGSFDAYARDGLGLREADIAGLRDSLLEGRPSQHWG
ncbi:tyrosine-protein phosphatase [Oscillochloris sp. ZM17-4]|uniref:tyrosine-protein phosphatase n=1 Tax=Oscillochloris sp. ZM17-4 TaxID=2866714 RepID=UPI001C73C481|nr:tyrosine-protein phosphatase [Oscillochloris sp. ZM17-4]MBX0326439.1 tyrosine-protein phosphatase [Oscillochloris sp. ZM17-4]